MLLFITVAISATLATVVVGQSCETQFAPTGARAALERVGNSDYSYSGWLNFWTPWFQHKDEWFVAETLDSVDIKGVFFDKGAVIKRRVPESFENYLAWWVSAGGGLDGWYWEQVNCNLPCVGDIMAGPADGPDSHTRLGIVTNVAARRNVHISDETGEVAESGWGFESIASGNVTNEKHFICWRYQIHQLNF